ncbi:MAG: DNA polymerase III subunit delta [Mariniblastus sp.]|jgi:DNA polymerase III subunit delta|nr:DNA polymerase III subunit delta [Mariniblastus sp.]
MSGTVHAFDLIHQTVPPLQSGVCPVFGSERFLKKLVIKTLLDSIAGDDAEFSSVQLDGPKTTWAAVNDELSMSTLFGGSGLKLVVIDDADSFVKEHRSQLEKLVENPPTDGLLILVVDSWAANTKLYKRIDKTGLQVDCDPPHIKRGKNKTPDEAKIAKWLISRARTEYDFELPMAGPAILIELTECNFGRMEQELAKLALYAADQTLDNQRIREIVGGWPAQTMWNAIDSATDGDAGVALGFLDQLLRSGEHPLALLGQMSWSLRRYAEVFELTRRDVRDGQKVDLNRALEQAGFRRWGGELDNASRRLKQLGRERVSQINRWLLDADLALKGTHSKPERGRLVLEEMFVKMSRELSPAARR